MAKEDYWGDAVKTLHLKESSAEGGLELGTFTILESDHALDKAVEERLRYLKKERKELQDDYDARYRTIGDGNRDKILKAQKEDIAAWEYKALFRYPDYVQQSGNIDALESKLSSSRYRHNDDIDQVARGKFVRIYKSTRHTPNRAGYRRYLKDQARDFYNQVLEPAVPAIVDADNHRLNTYIVGTIKSGKTELLKTLVYEFMQADDASVVFIDPAGDASREIARWREHQLSGRLIYIDFSLSEGYTPTLNPFDAEGLSDKQKVVLAQEVVSAFSDILKGELGGTLSVNMRALLIPAIRLLLDIPGSTLRDLERLMLDDPELIALGSQSRHEQVANFFDRDWKRSNFKVTKASIATKIGSILNTGVFEHLTCGKSTFSLKDAIDSKKIVVFNLAQGGIGTEETQAFGKFIVALVQGLALRRDKIPLRDRPMTHLIIDECHNFITPSIKKIIVETRKFGLAVTLAQPSVGSDMDKDIAKVVSTITHVRIVGLAGMGEAKRSSSLVGVKPEDIAELPASKGQFYYKAGTAPAFRLHARSDHIGFRNSMSPEAWKSMRKIQRDLFYRKIDGDQGSVEAPASAGSPAPGQPKRARKRELK